MEQRYLSVSKQLVELGYKYTLHPDSLLLVERLLADLIQTTENLRKYMRIAQDAVEERDNLRFGAEPYKCDNAKLVKECNELHLAFLQVKETNEKQQKELTKKIAVLEREKRESLDNQKKLRERVRELELDGVRKTDRHLRHSSGPLKSSTSVLTKTSKKEGNEVSSAMVLAEQKICNLMKEIGKLKDSQLELSEVNCDLKNKLNSREKEIQRLMSLLEGGRPTGALNSDCCYQDINVKLLNKQDEINYLQKSKSELEQKLKESRSKQHEAMKHALNLAEKNSVLEKELRDIDEMALAVEQECNTTVKNNGQKVKRLQERMQHTLHELQKLESEVISLRREKQCLLSDLEAVKIEKRHLQSILDQTVDDKKHLTDKINKFTIIERDLNNEIDRLVRASAEQKRSFAELKGQVLSGQYEFPNQEFQLYQCQCQCSAELPPMQPLQPTVPDKRFSMESQRRSTTTKKSFDPTGSTTTKKSVDQTGSPTKLPKQSFDQANLPTKLSKKTTEATNKKRNGSPGLDTPDTVKTSYKSLCDPEKCTQKIKEMIDQELSKRYPNMTDPYPNKTDSYANKTNSCPNKSNSLERLQTERDYYMKEYEALMEQCKNQQNQSEDFCSLLEKINEKEKLIAELQHKNDTLSCEKFSLMQRLESVRDFNDDGDSLTIKSSMKRLERERDLLKADLERMEEERDSMRQRMKVASELHNSEIERYQKSMADLETRLSNYEKERHELLQNQGSRRAAITSLEDQCETLKEQLKSTQADLTQHRTVYSQLKILHEQTDRALADSQGQLVQLEKELSNYQQRNNVHDSNTSTLNKEISNLKNDLAVMRQTLSDVESDNDSLLIKLDEKTEQIASLESNLQQKDSKLMQLEQCLCELKSKVSSTVEEKNTKDFLLKNTSCEIQNLKSELQSALRAKDTALSENRRLQDDLASCTLDARRANGELDIAKRQIEDLKRQLQHYCAEVKRIEDLMTQKEVERSEMLDQFRNLSHEAVTLENNNHSLEHEATQSKVQLSVALDHAGDLERQLDERTSIIKTYERQISEMNCQIASLEMQIKHYKMQVDQAEADLASVQELCVKLDKQKEEMQRQICDQEGAKMQVERDIQRYKRDWESLRQNVHKDQETVENLERLLSENRQQAVEQRLLNEDLQTEISRLKGQIKDLECNLAATTERLDIYQEKALEYSQQNKQLRRDMANERFFQSKDDDFHKNCCMRREIPSNPFILNNHECPKPNTSTYTCPCSKALSSQNTFLNRNNSDTWQFNNNQGAGCSNCCKLNSVNTSKVYEIQKKYNKECLSEAVNEILEKNERRECCCNKENEAGFSNSMRSPPGCKSPVKNACGSRLTQSEIGSARSPVRSENGCRSPTRSDMGTRHTARNNMCSKNTVKSCRSPVRFCERNERSPVRNEPECRSPRKCGGDSYLKHGSAQLYSLNEYPVSSKSELSES